MTDHNLFDERHARESLDDVLADYHQNLPALCRALDIKVSVVRDCDPAMLVAVMLIRIHRQLETRIMKLEARLSRAEGERQRQVSTDGSGGDDHYLTSVTPLGG